MANMSFDRIMEQITQICKDFQVEHLYLFGSRATDTAAPTSDIDIIVKGGKNIGELREALDQIPTLKKIDLFEYDNCENQYLKEDMDRYGKQIF